MKRMNPNILGLLLVIVTTAARAQEFDIDWFSLAGGGGTSAGGTYSVSGTVGQPGAGGAAMTGGSYSLAGGFWSLIAVVPTPGAPQLTVTHVGNLVLLAWPSPSSGFTLQQTGNLGEPGNWSSYGGIIHDDGTNKSVTITTPAGSSFFRLKQ
jgi:hypothetical protein